MFINSGVLRGGVKLSSS